PMIRQVRGLGTLVPEEIRWIPATTEGRVERIVLRPGSVVSSDTVILELTNPVLEEERRDAELKLAAAQAALAHAREQITMDLLEQKATAAEADAAFTKARIEAEMNAQLADRHLVPALTLKRSQIDTEQLEIRSRIAREQLDSRTQSVDAQIAVQQSAVDQ